jgi:hypothetical protein
MSGFMIGIAFACPISAIGFFIVLILRIKYKHRERLEDKKIQLCEMEKHVREEHTENALVVDKLMKMLQIEDWKWSHKHDQCRVELLNVIEALLTTTGDYNK